MPSEKVLLQISSKLDPELGGPFTVLEGTIPFITKNFSAKLIVFGSSKIESNQYVSIRKQSTIRDNRYGLYCQKTKPEIKDDINSTNLILIHGFYLASTLKTLRFTNPSAQIFIMPHGSLEEYQEKFNRLIKFFFKFIFKRLSTNKKITFITATKKEADNISKIFPRNQVRVVGIGISKNNINRSDSLRRNVIAVVGRCHPIKRIDIAIDAFGKLIEDYPEFKLHIIGSGSQTLVKQLKLQARNLGLEKQITFISHLSNNKVRSEISKAKILVNCSENENFSVVCAEAICEGTPVVTSQKTGFSEFIIKHGCGIAMENNDSDSIEHGLREVLSNWHEYNDNCLKKLKMLSWDVVAIDWLRVLAKDLE